MSESPERLSLEQVQAYFRGSPAIASQGLRAVALDYDGGELRVEMDFQPHMERKPGTQQFHGGPIAAFIDTVGDFAVGMLAGGPVPTINLRIDYVRPAFGGTLTGVARVRSGGRRISVVDVDVLDADGRLIAVGRGTYASTLG